MSEQVEVPVPTADDMRELGRSLGGLLRAGDLVVVTGDLGSGKTTLTQGIGVALGVRGPVTSPTFVIAREHPSLVDGPPLVHVDAYRIGGLAEIDDLDLDASVEEAITVVEWGEGLVEVLAPDRLEVHLHRRRGADVAAPVSDADAPDEPRTATLRGVGERWVGVALA